MINNTPAHHRLGKRPLILGKSYSPQPKSSNTNYESWEIIKAILNGYGPTSYWALAKACGRHIHGTEWAKGKGGAPWIDYLLKNGYLMEADES
jgi:hypothetical protein